MTLVEFRETISKSKVISKEITNQLLEFDVLPSTATQAWLNDFLVDLRNRIINEKDIIIEYISDKPVTLDEYNDWINQEFTDYSINLYMRTK